MEPASTCRQPQQKMRFLLLLSLLLLLLGSRAEARSSVLEEIIGGTECKPHSHPYMALLEITTNSKNHWTLCGGVLIRQNFVPTAAHCAGRSIKVFLGVHNRKKKECTWQKLEVAKQFPHPKYDDISVHHDIMLLKLKEKANLTLAMGTLPIPSQYDFISPRRTCRAVGWGETDVEKLYSDTLQEAKLRLLNPQACQHFLCFNHQTQFCVDNPRKTNSVFKGDSGGPLLCAGVAQEIASYTHKNATHPAVFTRISCYRPWINKILKK